MTFSWGRLFSTLLRLDQSGGGPPWPLQVWNSERQAWDDVMTAPAGVLYERADGMIEFVLTSDGNVIATR